MVYDITDRESFRAVDNWMADVEKFASESAIKLLVGNKNDLDGERRKVTYDEGKDLAAHYNCKFIEASAKTADNVAKAFQILAGEIKSKVVQKKKTVTSTPNDMKSNNGPKKLSASKSIKKSAGCCA